MNTELSLETKKQLEKAITAALELAKQLHGTKDFAKANEAFELLWAIKHKD